MADKFLRPIRNRPLGNTESSQKMMRAYLVLLNGSFARLGNTVADVTALEGLIEAKNLAKKNDDIVLRAGGWDNTVKDILEHALNGDRSALSKRKAHLIGLVYKEAHAIGVDVNTIEEYNQNFPDRINAILEPIRTNADYRHIVDCITWYEFHRREIINYPPDIDSFCSTLAPYFNRLYFNKNSIVQYLPTLHTGNFTLVLQTILFHLTALNDTFYSLYQNHRKLGLNRVCDMFQQSMNNHPIPFGCSVDIGGIPSLNITFQNNEPSRNITLYCDSHTKLWDYVEYRGRGDQGDRIYFHQPVDGLQENKILIARIGRHREEVG